MKPIWWLCTSFITEKWSVFTQRCIYTTFKISHLVITFNSFSIIKQIFKKKKIVFIIWVYCINYSNNVIHEWIMEEIFLKGIWMFKLKNYKLGAIQK